MTEGWETPQAHCPHEGEMRKDADGGRFVTAAAGMQPVRTAAYSVRAERMLSRQNSARSARDLPSSW